MSSKLNRLLFGESRTREDKIKCSSGLCFPSRCHRQHTPIKITHQSHHQHHQRHSTQKILSQPSTSCSQHTQVMAVQPKHTQALPWVGGASLRKAVSPRQTSLVSVLSIYIRTVEQAPFLPWFYPLHDFSCCTPCTMWQFELNHLGKPHKKVVKFRKFTKLGGGSGITIFCVFFW